jgi:hypothetical protein
MDKTMTEFNFERTFNELFPNTKISCFRYGNDERVYQIHYFIPLDNRHLKGSKYFTDDQLNYSHFTNIEGIKGILTSKRIRLYNINNLKDPREYSYAGIITDDPKKIKDAKENLFVLSLVKLDYQAKGFMSKKFNMWRLYGRDGKGCLIDFEFIINSPIDWHEFHFAPIRYGIKNKKNIIRLKQFISKMDTEKEKIGIDLDPLPCFHKSGLYRIEKEFRLLYDGRIIKGELPRVITQNGIQTFPNIVVSRQNKNGTVIKYLDLPIFTKNAQNYEDEVPTLMITSITLGYQHKKSFDKRKKEFETMAFQNLGYIPDIKLSLLAKTYWDK